MALKLILDSVDDLSEEIKKEYVEKEGKFHLDVEGVVAKQKLEEFRDNNIKLLKNIEELKQKLDTFKDVDPKKYKEALKKLEAVGDQTLIEEGKIKELLDMQTSRMKKDYDSQIDALGTTNKEGKEEVEKFRKKLSEVMINNTIQLNVSALSAKVAKGAMEDIIARGRRVFTMDHEKDVPVARNIDTGNPMFGKDGVTPLTIKEWVEDLPNSTPHFFEGSGGGGSLGGASSASERTLGMSKEEFGKLPPGERLKRIHSKSSKNKAA